MNMRRTIFSAVIILTTFLAAVAPGFGQSLYWENPRVFVPQGISSSSSVSGSSLMALAWQEMRPRSPTDRTSGDIFLSIAVSGDGITWTTHARFFGPIHYTGVSEGSEPRVYSVVMDQTDRILVAVAASDRETVILQSTDQGSELPAGPAAFRPCIHRRAEPLRDERRWFPPPDVPGVDERRPRDGFSHPRVQPFT